MQTLAAYNQTTQPTSLSWCISISSFLVTIFLVFITIHELAAIRNNFETDTLQSSIAKRNADELRNDLKRILLPLGLENWINLTPSQTSGPALLNVLNRLIQIHGYFSGDDFSSAAQEFEGTISGLGSMDSDSTEHINAIIDNLRNAQTIAKYNQQNLIASQSAKDELSILTRDYQSIQHRLYSFFGLSYADNTSDDLQFYSAGILKDLPVIDGFVDNISSFEDLGAAITLRGGNVTTENERDPHQFFVEKLEDLQTESFNLVLKVQSARQSLQQSEEKQKLINEQIQTIAQHYKNDINQIIVDTLNAQRRQPFNTIFFKH